ncbi:MAG: DUF58 domain-containing protein [Planctomycetes bacterium]|nr:DUF58 domain-containing protein [Planctomycetota bacterium]
MSAERRVPPLAEVERWAGALELAPPRRLLGAAGDRALARSGGASPELEERRPYVLGDDVRRIDWRGSLAHERLLLKLFRAELRPRLELAFDLSGSMAVDPAKAELAVDLAALLVRLAQVGGFELALWGLESPPRRLEPEELLGEGLELASSSAVPLEVALETLAPLLRAHSLRWILTDALTPEEPLRWLTSFAREAVAAQLVQVLAAADAEPRGGEAVILRDAEVGSERELVLDAAALARYRERFERHQRALGEACARAGVDHAVAIASASTREARLEAAVGLLLARGALAC